MKKTLAQLITRWLVKIFKFNIYFTRLASPINSDALTRHNAYRHGIILMIIFQFLL
jgi:hypothetical protein